MTSKANIPKPLPSRKREPSDTSSLRNRFRFGESLAEYSIKTISFISLAVIILIFIFVFREAAPLFFPRPHSTFTNEELRQETYGEEPDTTVSVKSTAIAGGRNSTSLETSGGGEGEASLKNLSGTVWQPVSAQPKYGLLPLVIGTLKVTLIAMLIAAPVGILSALFVSVFAPRWAKEILKPAIEILAGFPSVVIGFFALIVLASVMQNLFGFEYRLNALVGGVALSLAVIPIIFTVTEDALASIPRALTEASLALGATKWQTALYVLLPAATPGVFAALLLGIGRAFGETMIVLMATGNAALLSFNLVEPVRTMSATIGAEMAEVVFGEIHYNVLFLIGSIMFLFSFTLNAVAELFVRRKLMQRFKGS
ncbi:MAG: phosphate ABC transporter permease subunit PstC [Ignavibacteriae bacterium]|nr:phosphate ABC transporter permease subunit PstC [Ignavibacteria bacterium]MBI3363827.1 phosphate ABC transporter permease subunit PstC [Ignavibacteriota bacterium]